MSAQDFLKIGTFVGRVWREDVQGPSVVVIRNGQVIDITSTVIPTMRDLLEMGDPAAYVAQSVGEPIADISNLLNNGSDGRVHLLAPIDLQSVKACGVTFARSMVERVIEERAAGNRNWRHVSVAVLHLLLGRAYVTLKRARLRLSRLRRL